jgi:hypothetical protein
VCASQAQQAEPTTYPANKVLARALDIETGRRSANPHEARVSSGIMYSVLAASGALSERANASIGRADVFDFTRGRSTEGCANVFSSGDRTNTRVNQDCSLRRQAEGPDPEILQDIMSGVLIHRLLVDPVENTEATLRTYIEHLLVELGLLK